MNGVLSTEAVLEAIRRIRDEPPPRPMLYVSPKIHARVQAVADREGVDWMTAAAGIMSGKWEESA